MFCLRVYSLIRRETELCASGKLAVSWHSRTGIGLNKHLML